MLYNDEQIDRIRQRIIDYSRGGYSTGVCEMVLELGVEKEKVLRYGFRLANKTKPHLLLYEAFGHDDIYTEGASLNRMYNDYYKFVCSNKKHPDTLVVHKGTNGVGIISGLTTPFRDEDVWMFNGKLVLIRRDETDRIYFHPFWQYNKLSDEFLRSTYSNNLNKALGKI